MAITTYCAAGDVQKILSATGVSLRVDDDADASLWAREEAAVLINGYCQLLYSIAALAASTWVTRQSAWFAARELCRRRNNPVPQPLAEKCEALDERFEDIRMGQFQIPDAPMRKANAPVLSQQRVRYVPIPQAVTERGRSTGTPEGYPTFDDQYDITDYGQ